MSNSGFPCNGHNAPAAMQLVEPKAHGQPLWLLAELTYRCPLQCPYCSNPLNFADINNELSTDEWLNVFEQARALGAVQLGFSGGEPLVRQDLISLVEGAKSLGYYSNLITSGIGLTEQKVADFRRAGLDHIQVSFQASDESVNNILAGSRKAFEQKLRVAKEVKAQGYPMVLNFVTHRHNIDQIDKIIELCVELEADYVELATCQYYGWAAHNIDSLLPSRAQLERAEETTRKYREKLLAEGKATKLIFVTPDYYEERPKRCMNGWGQVFLTVTPDGTALPCHSARMLPLAFPNIRDMTIADIWANSAGFNYFRGDDWIREPCRSCDEKDTDLGGCRCQAFMLTGDMHNADPVCAKSPCHDQIEAKRALAEHQDAGTEELVFRNTQNARQFAMSDPNADN